MLHFSYEILNTSSEKITCLWNFCYLFPVSLYEWNTIINDSFRFWVFLNKFLEVGFTFQWGGGLHASCLLDVRHCHNLSLYLISRKTYPNSIKWRKSLFSAWFRPIGPNFFPFFPPKIWLRQSLDIMVSYHAQY